MSTAPPDIPDGPLLPPVRWLFAPDLIAYGKKIALHAFYGGELDPRDWMRLGRRPRPRRGRQRRGRPRARPAGRRDRAAGLGRAVVRLPAPTPATAASRCSPRRYVCGAELTMPAVDPVRARAGDRLRRPRDRRRRRRGVGLPRGQFLFVGGDTAYHVADPTPWRPGSRRPSRAPPPPGRGPTRPPAAPPVRPAGQPRLLRPAHRLRPDVPPRRHRRSRGRAGRSGPAAGAARLPAGPGGVVPGDRAAVGLAAPGPRHRRVDRRAPGVVLPATAHRASD
jgi:hypothetical protein